MPGLVWPAALGVVSTDEALPEPGSDEELVRVVAQDRVVPPEPGSDGVEEYGGERSPQGGGDGEGDDEMSAALGCI